MHSSFLICNFSQRYAAYLRSLVIHIVSCHVQNQNHQILLIYIDHSSLYYTSLIPRPLLILYVVWQYAARFLGKTEAISHVTTAH